MSLPVHDALPPQLRRSYKYIQLLWNQELHLLRVSMNVRPIQCYSLAVMAELQRACDDISAHPGLVRHYVMTSDVPGVFNFGGDLSLFVLLVRARDLESLKLYGRRCIDLVWWVEQAAERDIRTTVLVEGDTLGGGLESVLPFQQIIFERSAQAGFPEVLFNLFPGMGAWNFTIRRAGFAVANEMILSGKLYSAQELLSRGLVDHVVDDGEGEAAIETIVRSVDARQRGMLAALRARSMTVPITYEAMSQIVAHWAETALTLTDRDLRLMERLAKAQMRKVGGGAEGVVEEVKRLELDTAWGEERTGISQWATLD
ncbi:MAG: enoyl-CoA hydratase/isomerase family protein [Vitreoscilla sp.]|nr:enoyl-CoA hydratase/isomerase family protein [Burkholderiales bacterium]MBP6337867.1 enoyl-CoA hydratase/isomerase family protein [Vitreoscilla sp.]MBP6674419.1 enoyl-CoA hydratase/isomerase family protein [Vitreoscilla sp.]